MRSIKLVWKSLPIIAIFSYWAVLTFIFLSVLSDKQEWLHLLEDPYQSLSDLSVIAYRQNINISDQLLRQTFLLYVSIVPFLLLAFWKELSIFNENNKKIRTSTDVIIDKRADLISIGELIDSVAQQLSYTCQAYGLLLNIEGSNDALVAVNKNLFIKGFMKLLVSSCLAIKNKNLRPIITVQLEASNQQLKCRFTIENYAFELKDLSRPVDQKGTVTMINQFDHVENMIKDKQSTVETYLIEKKKSVNSVIEWNIASVNA